MPREDRGPGIGLDLRSAPLVTLDGKLMVLSFVARRYCLGGPLLSCLLAPTLCYALAPQPDGGSPPAKILPASLAGFSDEGTFYIYVNEDRVATINFSWTADGNFKNERNLSMAGQMVSGSMRVIPDPDGRWLSIPLETPLGPVSIVREAYAARKRAQGTEETIPLKPGTMLFENFAPALMSQIIRGYDTDQGGKQSFPVFIVPRAVVEASLERMDTAERSVAGRDMRLTRYVYGLPGVDITVWADADGRIYFAHVPAQHASYVREGYESLLRMPDPDPALSQADFPVKEQRGVEVPMRDGVMLVTDLFLPEGEGRFPAILIRTPYKKETAELEARYYARRGYVVAVQDCRGRFASQGEWEPFVHEPRDGHDAVEWLAGQAWCNGKVGMGGGAYLGWVQWGAASERPPHLVTIIPSVSPPDPFHSLPYDFGVFALSGGIWWADMLENRATADLSGAAMNRIREKKYQTLLRSLPVLELDKVVLGQENAYWRKWIAHPTRDEYWQRADFLERLENVDIPVFHQSGWFDGNGIGTKLNYARMVSHGHAHQKLVIGPWGQSPYAQRRYGDRDFGPQALVDLQREYLRWFDRWLKGVDNGIDREPLVSLFVMGSNRWLRADAYPLPSTRFEKLYLASGGRANTSWGNGVLTAEPPAADSRPDRYTYDPADPTPDPNAYEEPDEKSRPPGSPALSVDDKKKAREAYHESVARCRRDMLVYATDKFRQPLTLAGPLQAVLYASSSAKDTDWFARLMGIEESGKIIPLAEGKIRARFRRSMSSPEPLVPGEVVQYTLDLGHTAITIPAGHRLRVEIASASFPTFSRNLNTGGHNEMDTEFVPAQQTLYHDAERPSHVLLPVIPDLDSASAR